MLVQGVHYADLPYFVGLATVTIYIGAHRGLSSRNRQQLSMQQVRCPDAPSGVRRRGLRNHPVLCLSRVLVHHQSSEVSSCTP